MKGCLLNYGRKTELRRWICLLYVNFSSLGDLVSSQFSNLYLALAMHSTSSNVQGAIFSGVSGDCRQFSI